MKNARNSPGDVLPQAGSPASVTPPDEFHYVPVSNEVWDWECYVTAVGSQNYPPGTCYPCGGHPAIYDFAWKTGRILPEYALVLIDDGSGEYEFRNRVTGKCARGDVLLIAPGEWHRYRPAATTGWTELWVSLGGEYLHRLRKKGLIFAQAHLSLGEKHLPVRSALLELLSTVRSGQKSAGPVLMAKALEIITLVAQVHRATARGNAAERPNHVLDDGVAQALEFIWTNSHRAIRIADVAAAVGLPVRTLERGFAVHHPRAIRAEIEWSRFFRAKRLLSNTSLPIKEIAYACGFGDPRRMIDVFRRQEGETPSAVRARS